MKIKFTIAIILLIIGAWLFKEALINKYYSVLNKAEIACVQETLAAISGNDIDMASKKIDPNSKLLRKDLFCIIVSKIQKIYLKSMLISRISVSHENNIETKVINIFFNRNSDARMEVVLQANSSKNSWKVKDIFFNDSYFLE